MRFTIKSIFKSRMPKHQLLDGARRVFVDVAKVEPARLAVDINTLHAKIGDGGLVSDC